MDYDTRRIFKRIVIALVYILVIGGLYGLASLLRTPPPASCFDNVQNQGEEGVDCGGPCKTCEEVKELTTFEVAFFPTKQGFVDVIAEVRNTNLAWGIPKFSYVFELYDRDNLLVGSKGGVSYILPNSTKFIIEQAIPIKRLPSRVSFHFPPAQFEEVKNYTKPQLAVLSLRSIPLPESEAGFLEVQGTVVNQTTFNFDRVNVAVLLKNLTGKPLAVNSHVIRTLLANENRFFAVRWPYRVPYFTKIEAYPDTNVFEQSNYLKFLKEAR